MSKPIYEDLSVADYKSQFVDDNQAHFLLDVRTEAEYAEARIPGAVNIPLDELDEHIDRVTEAAGDNPIVVVCRTGMRSIMGAQVLRMGGLTDATIYNLDEGTMGWARNSWPLEHDENAE